MICNLFDLIRIQNLAKVQIDNYDNQITGKERKILSQSSRIKREDVLETIEGFAAANEKMLQKGSAVAGTREANKATKVRYFF